MLCVLFLHGWWGRSGQQIQEFLGGRFGYFFLFLLDEGPGRQGGGGGGRFFLENPKRGEGVSQAEERWGPGGCLREIGGGIFFFPGPKCPPRLARFFEGFIRHRPPVPHPQIHFTSPSHGSIWHPFNFDSTLIRHRNRAKSGNRCRINVESMLSRCQIDR